MADMDAHDQRIATLQTWFHVSKPDGPVDEAYLQSFLDELSGIAALATGGLLALKGIARTKGIVCKKVLCVKRYHEQIYRLTYFGIKHKQYN